MTRPARLKQLLATWKPEYLAKVAAAREEYFVLHVKGHCEFSDCPVRGVEFHVKDFDSTLIGRWQQRAPGCPLCKRSLTIRWALSREQYDERAKRRARESVNSQIQMRDHNESEETGTWLRPLDDTLPARVDTWNG